MTTAKAIAGDLRDYAVARDSDVGYETGLSRAMRDGATLIDSLEAEVERLRAVVEATDELRKQAVAAFNDAANESEALREAGEGLIHNRNTSKWFIALARWREVAGERDEPLTPAEKEAVAMGCDPGDMLTPKEQEAL